MANAIHERFVTMPSGSLRLCESGSGAPALVFLHGLGSDADAWRAQLSFFAPMRRCIAFDQRGHGASAPSPDGAYTIGLLADDLHAVLDALVIDRCVLVGHSMSGMVLTSYAGAHPARVAGLVYADAIGDFQAFPREVMERQLRLDTKMSSDPHLLQAAYEEMLAPASTPPTRERVLASCARMHGAAFAALRRSGAQFDAKQCLGSFAGPMLAIEAEGNEFPGIASRVLGIERKTVPGVGHWLMMDDPEGFNMALAEWLGL